MFFSSTKSENKRVEQVLPGRRGQRDREVAQTMYTHVSKCKNNKKIFLKDSFMSFCDLIVHLFLSLNILLYGCTRDYSPVEKHLG
jgi:hypothetical protein